MVCRGVLFCPKIPLESKQRDGTRNNGGPKATKTFLLAYGLGIIAGATNERLYLLVGAM